LLRIPNVVQKCLQPFIDLDLMLTLVSGTRDGRTQLFHINGLEQIVQRAGPDRTNGILIKGGRENDLGVDILQPVDQLKPILIRHDDIKENQLRPMAANAVQSGGHGICQIDHLDVIAITGEQIAQQLPAFLFIIDNDGFHAYPLLIVGRNDNFHFRALTLSVLLR